MYKTIVDVEGMMCGNCEKHMNERIEAKFDVKGVTSSHKKAVTEISFSIPIVIITENKSNIVMIYLSFMKFTILK